MSSNTSKLKVENVLKPPQKPTINKAWKLSVKFRDFETRKRISPKTMTLNRLETRVASGLIPSVFEWINRDIPKRDKLPKPPPIKTNNQVMSMHF